MLGGHVIKTYSNTQAVIALSSGEAEYYGMVKCTSVAIGIRSLLQDMNIERKVRVKTDASAAKGMAQRKGIGKVRHIEVNQLWVQEKIASGEIEVEKVPGLTNLADVLTKYETQEKMKYHLDHTNVYMAQGRHNLAPRTEGDSRNSVNKDDNSDDEQDE